MEHMDATHDNRPTEVIVIGGGAAGLSAALMLGRARRRVLVIDAGSPRNRFAAHVHGVLGFENEAPETLIARGRADAERYGVRFIEGDVEHVGHMDGGVRAVLSDGARYEARALILATGITDELPEIPGLAERWGSSVLHCPYCHGWEVAGARLGVLATSPGSLHQAQLLRQWSGRVTLFSAMVEPLDPTFEAKLRSRGIEIVASAVIEVFGDEDRPASVRTDDGREFDLDAIFTAGSPRPHDACLEGLGLERAELPFGMGTALKVDDFGKTSDERIWAIGNVVNPMANVPMVIGAGALTGAALNGALVEEDFAAAQTPAGFWEARYAETERVWSGRVNRVLEQTAATLAPGTALDLGCGEGGDAIWLARHGWNVNAVDLSPTAVARGRKAAVELGLDPGAVRFEASDLAAWAPQAGGRFDLVTCSFLQSWPVEIPREEILHRATGFVAPGGQLLITAHAEAPSWAGEHMHHGHVFPTPEGDLAALDLDTAAWQVLVCERRKRETTAPDGSPATLIDSVVLVRRLEQA